MESSICRLCKLSFATKNTNTCTCIFNFSIVDNMRVDNMTCIYLLLRFELYYNRQTISYWKYLGKCYAGISGTHGHLSQQP